MSDYKKELVALADYHCTVTGLKRGYIAAKITGNARFFDRLADGKGCTRDNEIKVRDWFKKNTPKLDKKVNTN